jgi:HAD superfamily hydrolase (TIGR01549 family)
LTIAIKAILFDLDDTLLGNNTEVFLHSYIPLLAEYVEPYIERNRFIAELLTGTRAMIDNKDPESTNREIFWSVFSERTGIDQAILEPHIAKFYMEEFGKLKRVTRRRPETGPVMSECLDQGFQVVIASNPIFPRTAIEQRLEWAGVSVSEFDYNLVTCYENMHVTKPHSAYYAEILSQVSAKPGEAIMVGDDWKNDIEGAACAGLYTYWVTDEVGDRSDTTPGLYGIGDLNGFRRLLDVGSILPLRSNFHT